jgi:phospholipase C
LAPVASYDVANGNVFITFETKGAGLALLSVMDNAYGTRPHDVPVPPGEKVEEAFILAESHHWYDLSVTTVATRASFAGWQAMSRMVVRVSVIRRRLRR